MGLVSVLMPMKNAARFVEEALRSVLDQVGVDLDLIVIDDDSTDGSSAIVRGIGDARVRVIPGPRCGIAAAFNEGLALARGDLLARCDADDAFAPGRLAWQSEWLEQHPDFGAVCGCFAAMTEKGRFVADLAHESAAQEITNELRAGVTRTSLCTFTVRTAIMREIDGCRAYFVTAEDIDLLLRLGERTRVWYEPKPTYRYRLHGSSVTHRQSSEARLFYESTARAFQEQRKARGQDDLERGQPPAPPKAESGTASPVSEQIQGYLTGQAWGAFYDGRRADALRLGVRACLARPLHWRGWKNLAVLGVKCLRNRGQT